MLPTTASRSSRSPLPHRPASLRGVLTALAVLGALCALVLGTASSAAAHAVLTGSDPADGAVVDSAPERITLTFSEGVALTDDSIRVLDPEGERADTGGPLDLSTDGTVSHGVALRSPGSLPEGTYTVTWQAVSADSHPVSGAFTFSIGAPSDTAVGAPEQQAGGGAIGFLYGLFRYLAYAGFVLLVGGATFVLACWPGGARIRALQRLVTGGWITLTATTLVMLLLRNPYRGSGQLLDAFDLGGLKETVGTGPGAALVSRLLLLATAALFCAVLFGTYAKDEGSGSGRSPGERRDIFLGLALGGIVVAAGLAATWAMSEHASTGIQTEIAMPVDVVHLLAAAAWLGGVTALLLALRWGPPVPPPAVRRFSRLAFGSVLALVATGLYQSWRQVGFSWSGLTGTDYGRLLLLKVALVAVLVGIGWYSRRWTARLVASASSRPHGAEAEVSVHEPSLTARGTTDGPAAPLPEPGDGTGSGDGTGTGTGPGGGTGPDSDPDPERAAQLARQRRAMTAARLKRARDADPHRSGLRRSVLAEAGVAVVVLAVTTLLTGTEPARTEQTAQNAAATDRPGAAQDGPVEFRIGFDTGGTNGKGTAEIRLSPGRTGKNTLEIRTTGPGGAPLDAPEVKIALTLPAEEIGPLRLSPDRVAPGRWTDRNVQLPVAGSWEAALTIRTSDIDQTTETKTVKIG